MEYLYDVDTIKQRLQEWYHSEEYQQLCQRFSSECTRLSLVAQRLYPQIDALKAFCHEHTVRQELAVHCRYMHRGFYCPSPVYDLVIGNARRGNILKRPNSRSKPTHIYGFDSCDRLLWSRDNELNFTEYLLYEDNAIYGIIVDDDGVLHTLTEEIYQNSRLTVYHIANFFHRTSEFSCDDLYGEYYEHDEIGLCAAQIYNFNTPMTSIPEFLKEMGFGDELLQPSCQCFANWRFEREGEYIVGYRAYPTSFDMPVSPVYPIKKPRKA